jgi:hypothetical protein
VVREQRIRKDVEESHPGLIFKELCQNLRGGTGENHEDPELIYPVSGPRLEPRKSRIRSGITRTLYVKYKMNA